MKISYSAPAKVILSGEHAVVYGKPAIVAALDLRLKFNLWEDKKNTSDETILLIADKVRGYLKKQKIPFKNKKFNFEIESDIPIKQRLGSSGALSVAASAAFLEFFTGKEFDKETINNVAYQSEKYFHKNASGVDPTTSTFGGLIFYRKEFEFLKNISALNFKIPKKIEEGLYLIDSGNPVESTGYMVNEVVGGKYNKSPRLTEEILNDIEKTVKRMVVAIVKEDLDFFIKTLVDNQIFLEMLGVVSMKAKNLLKNLEPYGYGKVTGGGGKKEGSGYLLFYTNKQEELETYCKKKKINFFRFKQSYEGVKREQRVKTSAPGKLMLLGEHAVASWYPCIVTAVDKRIFVEAEITDEKEDEIITPQVKESRFVLEALSHFREKFKIHKHIKISTQGDFSHNVGLGSSSAVTVATFLALSSLFNLNLSKKEIFDLGYAVTLKIQGVGSGFDIAAATFGGTLYFVKGGEIIEPLNIDHIPLVVGYSGIKADTPFYIRKVAEAYKDRKSEMVNIFIQMAELVNKAKKSLLKKDYPVFGKFMIKNQRLLQKLGVSIPQLDRMIKSAQDSGAYGAKLSGAGGGDCMIALVSNDKKQTVEEAIKKAGGEIINVKNNAEGVRIEK